MIFSSLLSLIIYIFNIGRYENGHEILFLLPMFYIFCYIFFILPLINEKKFLITIITISIISWVRFVLTPFIIVYSKNYEGFIYLQTSPNSINLAIALMCYELFITNIFLYMFIKIQKEKINTLLPVIRGSKKVYFLFLVLTTLVLIFVGIPNNILQFFIIEVDGTERVGDIKDTSMVLIQQILISGLILAFAWSVEILRNKYNLNKKVLYVNIAILLATFNVSVIIGERRSYLIYSAIASIILLIRAFPFYKRKILFTVSTVSIVVIGLMSVYKFFYAFHYDSYIEAFANSELDIGNWAATLQAYFLGPENVALAIEMSENESLSILNVFYDIGRSVFGLSFIFKSFGATTVEIFNTYNYGYSRTNGQILSTIGYGYSYVGFLLAPMFVIFNVWISIKLEYLLKNTNSLIMIYLWSYLLMRFTIGIYTNPAPLISLSTIMLGTIGLLYVVSIIVQKLRVK